MSRSRRDVLSSALETFPLAVLLVDADAAASTSNGAWTALSGLDHHASRGAGWLDAVEPVDRHTVVDRLLLASANGSTGSAEYRLTGPNGRRWTRWWWHPTSGRGLVIVVADVDDDRTREATLWQRATHDPLTGLVNRTQLLDLVERVLQHRDVTSSPPAIVYADLDGFKTVNDNGGHRAGDSVLRAAAERMANAVRPEDVLARVGGDEFAILCETVHSIDEAEAVAERLRRAVDLSVDVNGEMCAVTVTTGIAVARTGDTAEGLLARADEAMYAGKTARIRPPATPRPVREKLTEAELARTIGESADALAHVERALSGTWSAVAGAPRVDPEVKDRLVQAARLVAAALRALDPGWVP